MGCVLVQAEYVESAQQNHRDDQNPAKRVIEHILQRNGALVLV